MVSESVRSIRPIDLRVHLLYSFSECGRYRDREHLQTWNIPMDIKNLSGKPLRTESAPSGSKSRVSAAGSEPPSVKAQTPAKESVTLTAAAQSLSAARDSAKTAPFDAAKVAEIKAAITEGRYPIDNQRLADRMINLESLLA